MECCYKGYIHEFLSLSKEEWLNEMKENCLIICNEKPSDLQVIAWEDCYEKLVSNMSKYRDKNYYLIFEYVLPHEGGRRPDLIILAVEVIKDLSKESMNNKYRTLALVTGVPGAGKTLLGLKCVYECFESDKEKKSIICLMIGLWMKLIMSCFKLELLVCKKIFGILILLNRKSII